MLKYYLKDGSREKGPFVLDDLKYQRIRPATLIKIDNGEWKAIKDVPDLAFLMKLDDHTHSSASYAKPDNHTFQQSAPEAARRRARMIAVAIAIAILGMGMAMFFYAASSR